MNPATLDAFHQFVQQVVSGAQNAATWTVGQAPLVVQEWLQWQQYQALMLIAFSLLGVLLGVGFARNRLLAMRARIAAERYVDTDGYIAGIVLGLVLSAASALELMTVLLTLVKVIVAPRVVVLEKFVDLIK